MSSGFLDTERGLALGSPWAGRVTQDGLLRMRRSLSNTGCGHEGRSPNSALIRGLGDCSHGEEQRGRRSSSLGWVDSPQDHGGEKRWA